MSNINKLVFENMFDWINNQDSKTGYNPSQTKQSSANALRLQQMKNRGNTSPGLQTAIDSQFKDNFKSNPNRLRHRFDLMPD